MLKHLKDDDPYITKEEGSHPFTECATFADDIKGKGFYWSSEWHYVDQPYLSEGDSIKDYPNYQFAAENLVEALKAFGGWLKGDDSQKNTVYIQEVMDEYPVEKDAKSFALRMVIHLIGDIHQPLHTTSEVNSQFPEGDRGGNGHKAPSKDGANNLHAIWDSVLYEYATYPNLPYSNSDWSWISNEASKLSQQYPVSSSKVYKGDYDRWAQEGLDAAGPYVYDGFVDNQLPSKAYQDRASDKLKSMMMYGARRLAEDVIDMYNAR